MRLKSLSKLFFVTPLIVLTGCSSSTTSSKYNVVVQDAQMAESLGVLGYAPTLCAATWDTSSFNTFKGTIYEDQNYYSNAEKLLSDKPKIFIDYSLNPTTQEMVESYGGKYIPFPKGYQKDQNGNEYKIQYSQEESAAKSPILESWANLSSFWGIFNDSFKKPLDQNYQSKIDALRSEFNERIKALEELIKNKYNLIGTDTDRIKVTMWGQNSGIEVVPDPNAFDQYGYDVSIIDWLFGYDSSTFDSLNFDHAYPYSTDIEYVQKKNASGFGTTGWYYKGSGGQVPQKNLQPFFHTTGYDGTNKQNQCDLVIVKYAGNNIDKLKENFSKMVGGDKEKVIVVAMGSSYAYNPITWHDSVNELFKAIDPNNQYKTPENIYYKDVEVFKNLKPKLLDSENLF